ncbi:MAG: YdcF family protein [Candidatus Saccharimonadales bacterium]
MTGFESDAIISLGGGLDKQGLMLPRALARVDKAVELYDEKIAPRIITVGGYWLIVKDADKPPASEAQQSEDYAITRGVSKNDIYIAALQSRETIGNALFAKQEALAPNDWRRIHVVTSETHLPRSLLTFEHVLGPDYTVKGVSAPEKLVLLKRAYEMVGLMMQRYVLDGTEPGDDEAITARLLERVPGYDNDITPKELAVRSLLHVVRSDEPAFHTLAQAA